MAKANISNKERVEDVQPIVELQKLEKYYDDILAVDKIDLTINQGEFFSLVGPSGCGKTTTLRMINGFERPTSGSIKLNGRAIENTSPNQRNTNLVFQGLAVFPHMTVAENVGYGLKKSNVDSETRNSKVTEYLTLVGLEDFHDRNVTDLSGGQQQRVALVRALINEPSILLLDEPLASLDRKLRKQMRIELREIHEETQGAFFYVTHDQETAMTLSDRLAVMRNGKIEQVGPPEEIYKNPVNTFVANFIGDTNIISGQAIQKDNGTTIRISETTSITMSTIEIAEGRVNISIRPEDVKLSDDHSSLFQGVVMEKSFQGDHVNCVIHPEPDGMPELNVQMSTNNQVETGETAPFTILADNITIFEDES